MTDAEFFSQVFVAASTLVAECMVFLGVFALVLWLRDRKDREFWAEHARMQAEHQRILQEARERRNARNAEIMMGGE